MNPRPIRLRRSFLLAACLLALLPACSDDDGASTREGGGSVQIIGPQPEAGGGSVSAVGAGCTTKGATTKLAAKTIEIRLDEYTVAAPAETTAGVTRVLVKNLGSAAHGIVITRTGSAASLPRKGTAVDLDALPAEATFRIEPFAGNTICEGTFDLPAGSYLVFCPEAPAGGASHLDQGMVATLVVA